MSYFEIGEEFVKKNTLLLITLFLFCLAIAAGCGKKPDIDTVEIEQTLEQTVFSETDEPESDTMPEFVSEPEAASDSEDNGPFTILWITDTQGLSYKKDGYLPLAEWCTENMEEKNIRFVAGTGDMVQSVKTESQWEEFLKFKKAVDEYLPSLYVAGNHDMKLYDMTYNRFINSIYGEGGTEDQSYRQGQGKYELFTAGGIDWLVIGMSFGYGEEEANWVKKILDEYPERKAILLFHDYLNKDGNLMKNAKLMFRNAVESSPNVVLILCGHNAGYIVRTDEREGGYVQTIFCNKQNQTKQLGSIQTLRIDPETGTIEFDYFSPISDKSDTIHDNINIDIG